MESSRLASGLYVVATPIGNLEDITLRALRVLREVDLIACEDTRHTQKLLDHFQIKTPTKSYHQHNEAARATELVKAIRAGSRIALVSDAGMPAISDPGEQVVRRALGQGLNVVVIPGPSALISALVASGLPTDSFRFVGFLPARSGARRTKLETLRNGHETLVFYEAPHRILEMLADAQTILGPQRRMALARELTKIHEEFLRGTIAEVSGELQKRSAAKGEMTVLISGAVGDEKAPSTTPSVAQRMGALMTSAAMDQKSALKHVARELGLSKSEAYREWQRAKTRKQ